MLARREGDGRAVMRLRDSEGLGFMLDRDDFLADDAPVAPKLGEAGKLGPGRGKHHWATANEAAQIAASNLVRSGPPQAGSLPHKTDQNNHRRLKQFALICIKR